MKNRHRIYLLLILIVAVILTFSSCSGGRDNEEGPDAGSSQLNLTIRGIGSTPFNNSNGYNVTIESGSITLKDLSLVGAATDTDEDDDHDHQVTDRHDDDDTTTETGSGPVFTGFYTFDLSDTKRDLGFANGDPGTYDAFTFLVHPASSNDENGEASVIIEGTAVKDNVTYRFHVTIDDEDQFTATGLGVVLEIGKYKRMELHLNQSHWFDQVDFGTLTAKNGMVYLNHDQNQEAAQQVFHNILDSIHPLVIDDE